MIYIAPRRWHPIIGWDLPAGARNSWKLRASRTTPGTVEGEEGDLVLCWGGVIATGEAVATDWTTPMTLPQRQAWAGLVGGPVPSGGTMIDRLWERSVVAPDPAGLDTMHPILPSAGTVTLVLDGQRVRSMPADWTTLNAQIERIRAIYERKKAEGQDPANTTPQQHYRQWARVLRQRNRLDENAILDIVTRPGKPREATLQPGTTLTESFTTVGDTFGGDEPWTEVVGDWDNITGGIGYLETADTVGYARCDTTVSSDNHYAQLVQVNGADSGANAFLHGPCARFAAAATTCYLCTTYDGSVYLQECTAGSRATLAGPTSITAADNDVWKLDCGASGALETFQNDTSRNSATDTSLDGNTQGGIIHNWSTGSTASFRPRTDDWEMSDGVAAAGSGIYRHLRTNPALMTM